MLQEVLHGRNVVVCQVVVRSTYDNRQRPNFSFGRGFRPFADRNAHIIRWELFLVVRLRRKTPAISPEQGENVDITV